MKKQDLIFEVTPGREMTPAEVDTLTKLLAEWWRRDLESKQAENSNQIRKKGAPGGSRVGIIPIASPDGSL